MIFSLLARTLAVAAVLTCAVAPPASAQTSAGLSAPADEVVLDPAASQLALAYHLTDQDASARISRQQPDGALLETLATTFSGSYAGGWIDQTDGGQLHIRFTTFPGDLGAVVSPFALQDVDLIAGAAFPLQQLQVLQRRVQMAVGDSPNVRLTIDVRNNFAGSSNTANWT